MVVAPPRGRNAEIDCLDGVPGRHLNRRLPAWDASRKVAAAGPPNRAADRPTRRKYMSSVNGPKWMTIVVVVVMLAGLTYIAHMSRQAAQAGASWEQSSRSSHHVTRVQGAIRETEQVLGATPAQQ